ncbi:sugar diacid recognition domain-containing protein [Neobacillus sp. OS1-2]|uniref:sugar diacid recognition domain-containing protein n=1 Tax=Neobacillus sp. OS1-2 TaxID=3070680 RepID=UPI0027E08AE4|nr:sugar diacid recognition domain-containing protein [Neobacillus sp. OS1-2]WML39773.1 sugar diacid recognition domain-containing protein [Neobacillus sp. OS1-2]
MKFLDQTLAQEIVNRTMKIINRNINVMNDKGVIIGSGDKTRIDSIHEGAIRVIENQSGFEIESSEAEKLHGVKAGINLPIKFHDQIVGVIGITGVPEEIRSYGELVKMAAEMILQQAVLLDEMQWDERLKEELISQLLHDPENLDAHYFERVKRLGIDLDIPRIAIIVTVEDRPAIFKAIRDRLQKEDLYIMQPDYLVLLKKVNEKNSANIQRELEHVVGFLETKEGGRSKISVGSYHPTLKGLADSYQEAILTSAVGRRLDPQKMIYFFEEYKIPVFLAKANKLGMGGELADYYHQLKKVDKKGELVETLLAYVEENGDIHTITGKLFIHRNTLRYRLDRIMDVTGKDPRKVKDLLELYLSVIIDQIM